MAVRQVLLDEACTLRDLIARYDITGDYQPTGGIDPAAGRPGVGFTVGLCSGDPVSAPAAVSFNRKIGGVVANCRAYVADLFVSCEHLASVARTYGVTDEAIAESFRLAEERRADARRAEARL
ncbi:MAG: hypothetical protein ABW212_04530 [Pseudonocardia sediminis]